MLHLFDFYHSTFFDVYITLSRKSSHIFMISMLAPSNIYWAFLSEGLQHSTHINISFLRIVSEGINFGDRHFHGYYMHRASLLSEFSGIIHKSGSSPVCALLYIERWPCFWKPMYTHCIHKASYWVVELQVCSWQYPTKVYPHLLYLI